MSFSYFLDHLVLCSVLFRNKAKALPISLIKEKLKSSNYEGAKLPTIAYSRGIIALKYFAPAVLQSAALLLMIQITQRILRTLPPHPQRATRPWWAHTPQTTEPYPFVLINPLSPSSPAPCCFLTSHRGSVDGSRAPPPPRLIFPSTVAISLDPAHRPHLVGFLRPPPTTSLLAASQPP
jgi:hypothetical protein